MSLTISSGDLGYYGSDRFCPRCAWVKLHLKPLPYQSFPGIFSTIDRYNKLIVQNYYDRESGLPLWLQELGEVEQWVEPPHWKKFSVMDSTTGVTLRGEADAIFRMSDRSYTIVDYKTSKYTPGQRGMFQQYEVQLNGYAYIGERLAFSPVTQLALVYMEPQTDEKTSQNPQLVDSLGFSMGFGATIVPIDVKPDVSIPPLLEKVKEIGEMEGPPPNRSGCSDCQALRGLITGLER